MTERICWSDEREHTEAAGEYFVTIGHVHLLHEPLFEIRPPAANDGECWTLTSPLPGWHNRCLTAAADDYDSKDFLKAEAGVWLGAFLASIGADDPNEPAAVEPLTDVPMVCTACRNPAKEAGPGLWEHEDPADTRQACNWSTRAGTPVKVMVAAGNENVPRKPASLLAAEEVNPR